MAAPTRSPRSKPRRTRALDHRPQKLAAWRRKLLWAVWLGFFGLAALHSDRAAFGWQEFAALIVATAVTAWCRRQPRGGGEIDWTKPENLTGPFESRTNWALALFAALLCLGALAGLMRTIADLRHGYTVGDIVNDIGVFIIEWIRSLTIDPLYADPARDSRMYILVVLAIPGPFMLWLCLQPLPHRGRPFRLENDTIFIPSTTGWQPLDLRLYRVVKADGLHIVFCSYESSIPSIHLPQQRVYSRTLDARIPVHLLGEFFRALLSRRGFAVTPTAGVTSPRASERWEARRV